MAETLIPLPPPPATVTIEVTINQARLIKKSLSRTVDAEMSKMNRMMDDSIHYRRAADDVEELQDIERHLADGISQLLGRFAA